MGKMRFNPKATNYDSENSYLLAVASELAYKSEATIKKTVVKKWGLRNFQYIKKDETEVFIAGNNNMIIVAFAGTSMNIEDFLTDIKCRKENGPFGMVHRGFQDALKLVWNELLTKLGEFQDNKQPVWACGHSLGGALAVLFAGKLLIAKKRAKGLYTYGQPRVGNKTFAGYFNTFYKNRYFRVVNNNDIVTRVPNRFMGYQHEGRMAYITTLGQVKLDYRYWKMFLDRAAGRKMHALTRFRSLESQLPDGLKDHFLKNYIKHLKKVR